MAYQKLQTYQAIQVIPDNNITIPAPNEVASGTTNGTGAGLLIDSSAKFLTTASVGDVIYNTSDNTITTVLAVDSDIQLQVGTTFAAVKNYTIYSQGLNEGCILYVGGTGDVVVETVAGNEVTFTGVQGGTFMPVQVLKVKTTGTATNIIAMW